VRDARVLGQYTLLERLGEGGMGVVYRARHAMLRRPTALKLLSARGASAGIARFEREVQILASLNHPNTVAIHDYGHTDDGAFYYVMEYLDGIDLERLVELDGAQPPARVVHILAQACEGLGEAHAAGVIHRDVKPANIFLCRRWGRPDVVKVLDFGLAREVRPDAGLSSASGEIAGTPLYMSPEAATAPNSVDERSDVYSLGAVGYLLLAGRPVFSGTAAEVCARHVYTAPDPPGRGPEDLTAVIMRCLAKAPGDRHDGVRALAAALARCRDAGGWSDADGESWWRGRAEALAAGRPDGGGSSVGETIAVAPRRRTRTP
jgi:eukaryotic-like serine/threonine-protein kinase